MLILASRSPRRAAILLGLGLEFKVDPVDVDETFPAGATPENGAVRLAQRKLDVATRDGRHAGDTVLAADTVVALGPRIFGKPGDAEDAKATLQALSGRRHTVITGLAVQGADGRRSAGHVVTDVEFALLGADQVHAYVATGEPLDKAGAYAIQGAGAALVRSLRGDYTNVVGLPVRRTLELLHEAGHALPAHLRPG